MASIMENRLFKAVLHTLKAVPSWFWQIIGLFLATRIALTIIGVVARPMINITDQAFKLTGITWLDIWGVWDSKWYMRIAADGYSTKIYEFNYSNYGFFPLYPLLMRYLGDVIGSDYIAGLLISNIALLVACVYLYKLVRLDDDAPTALRSVKYLLFFPVAFILSGVFSEGLFLALLVACFYYARKQNWLVVGILGFFLSLTRYIGVVAVLPFLYEYLASKNFKFRQIKPNALFLLLVPAGFLTYMAFVYYLTGDPLGYFHIQKTGWGFSLSNPLPLLFGVPKNHPEMIAKSFIFAGLALLLLFRKRMRFSYWLLAMYSILIPPFSSALAGTLRFMVPIFPLYILLAKLGKNRHFDLLATAFLLLLQGFLMVFWTVGAGMII